MKILLISSNIAISPYPVYPLGLSMVAMALQNAGHEVCQFDFLQQSKSIDAISLTIQKFDPEIIGISIRNIDNVNLINEQRYIDVVKKIAQNIRLQTDALIVLGGSGFSIMPEIIINEVGADYGIVGEGEALMVKFVANAKKKQYPDKQLIRSPLTLMENQIPSANYDPNLMEFYQKSGNIASVQTKRGCNHKCVYCSYPLLEGSAVRCREPQSVIDDIRILVDLHGAKYLFFIDSVFNDDHGYYLDLVRLMKKQGVNIAWTAFFKPEHIDDKIIELMKQTGFKAAEIGADASTDITLRKLGKSFLFKDIIASNQQFVRHGITTAHFYMFGTPGETRETVLEGIDNIKSLKKTVSFMFMGIRILPGTLLLKTAIKEKIISKSENLLKPVYYIAPGLDKNWLKKTLTNGFSKNRHCIFPPDALDSSLQFLHKMGYSGSMWDLLLIDKKK